MKNLCKFFRILSIALIPTLLFFVPTSVDAADSPSPAKIAFLRLEADSTGFRLIDATIVNGTLKSPRGELILNDYSYELAGKDSTVLFNGGFENPLTRRFEYEDPENPGQILVKVIELPTAEFTIRVPVTSFMHQLDIYRNEQVSARGNVQPTRKLVTSISVQNISKGTDK